jgi:hypothetical protein
MDALGTAPHHARVRVLPHIKRLNDCFGDFLVRLSRAQRPRGVPMNPPQFAEIEKVVDPAQQVIC